MILDPYLAWLGIRAPLPVAGLHITSEYMTLVAARRRPLRLIAIGRWPIPDAAVVGDEIRLVKPLAGGLKKLVEETRLAPGSLTVAAVEPIAGAVTIWDDGPEVLAYNVAQATYAKVCEVVDRAGLGLIRVDIVPAALARLGRKVGAPSIASLPPTYWSVVTTEDGFIDATRSDPGWGDPGSGRTRPDHGLPGPGGSDRRNLAVGFPGGADVGPGGDEPDRTPAELLARAKPTTPVVDLAGIHVPKRLREVIDPARDAVAIGAALGAYDHPPIVSTQPVAAAVGPDWTVQYVVPFEPETESHHQKAVLEPQSGPETGSGLEP